MSENKKFKNQKPFPTDSLSVVQISPILDSVLKRLYPIIIAVNTILNERSV